MLGNRLSTIRKQLGFSQVELATAMGGRYDQTMISHVENGRTGLVAEGLMKAAEVLGVSVDYLLGVTDNPQRHRDWAPDEPVEFTGTALINEIGTTVEIGRLNVLDWTPRDQFRVSVRWLTEQGIDHSGCFMVRFVGDTMLPSLPRECRLLVAESRRAPRHGSVFLLDSLEGVLVKRILRRDDREWVVRNDNPRYPGEVPLDSDIEILGEVVWFEGNLRDIDPDFSPDSKKEVKHPPFCV